MKFARDRVLQYKRAASVWHDAMPLGNGSLGAMVHGGVDEAVFDLNEERLWSGAGESDWNNPEAPGVLMQIRKAVADGNYRLANDLCYKIQGRFNESYIPLGQLKFKHEFTAGDITREYSRTLDIFDAVHTTVFCHGDMKVTRESFISYPDKVLAVRVHSSRPLTTAIKMSTQLRGCAETEADGMIMLSGIAPSHIEKEGLLAENGAVFYDVDNPGLSFCAKAEIKVADGSVATHNDCILIRNCCDFTVILAASVNFGGCDVAPKDSGINPQQIVSGILKAAANQDYTVLKERHCRDFSELMSRVEFVLPAKSDSVKTTSERLLSYKQNRDPALISLIFQYGRYLLISSSRPGSLPATLQGIWNDRMRPAWMSNWTMDQNLQMTYWASWTTNLSECEEPLLHFIDGLRPNGRETARVNYNARGWVCHNTVDIWNQTAPAGIEEPRWCILPLGGVWACQHLWMHYCFHGDRKRLEKDYPVMREAAVFCMDWLIRDSEGFYGTCPSISPENWFMTDDGHRLAVSESCTYDIQLIRELFENCIKAADVLGVDEGFAAVLKERIDGMRPMRIGCRGQLQEWSKDWDSPGDHHRHISHLVGLFPGEMITSAKTPDLWQAARISLVMRTDSYNSDPCKNDADTGWSLAWKIGWWARLHDGGRVGSCLLDMLTPCDSDNSDESGGMYKSLLNASPPFTLEGNMGITAGVAEALMQSHDGIIHVLPAIPEEWASGRVKGLKARGGIIVDIEWDLTDFVRVRCYGAGAISVKYREEVKTDEMQDGVVEIEFAVVCRDVGAEMVEAEFEYA